MITKDLLSTVLAAIGLLGLNAGLISAQTKVDLRKQARNVDFSAATSTKPFQSGTNLPATCSQGEVFFKTNAASGANFYGCTSTNTWTLESGDVVAGTGTIVSHSPLSIALDTSYLNTLYPGLGSSNTFTAGSRQTFTPSATTEGIRIVCGTVPSTISPGGLFCTPTGVFGYYDGLNQKYPVVSTTSAIAPNLVFAGPSSGAAAIPGPRPLESVDLPIVTRREVCSMIVGSDNGSVLVNGNLDIGRHCYVPYTATVIEIIVAADAGTPSLVAGCNRAGAISNLTSSALATAASGGLACANASGAIGLDGATTCANTLQNTSLNAGDWIELVSGTAGGVAKRVSLAVTFTIN